MARCQSICSSVVESDRFDRVNEPRRDATYSCTEQDQHEDKLLCLFINQKVFFFLILPGILNDCLGIGP